MPHLEHKNSKHRNKKNAEIKMSCILNFYMKQNHRKTLKCHLDITHENIGIVNTIR
jgi:hypothetical protein